MNSENKGFNEDPRFNDRENEQDDWEQDPGVWEETKRLYNRYKAGKITKKEYCELLAILLKDSLSKKAKKTRSNITGSYYVDEEDLLNDFFVVMFEKVDTYDPYISPPLGFLKGSIRNKAIQTLGPEVKPHFKNNLTRLSKVAKSNGYKEGLMDPNLTPDTLSILSGESIKVCNDTMELSRKRMVSLDEVCENGYTPTMGDSPESAYIKKEKMEIVMERISRLNPVERFICEHFIMADEKKHKCLNSEYTKGSPSCVNEDDCRWTIRQFIDYFKLPEHFKKYADYLPKNGKIDTSYIKKIINRVIRLLRNDKKVRSFGDIKDTRYEIPDQASYDDLDSAVFGGLFDDDMEKA